MPLRLRRLPALLVTLAAASLIAPAAASASHIQGGSISSKITSNGHLQGTVTFLTDAYGYACTVGDPADQMPLLTITTPTNQTADIYPDGTNTRCLPNSTTATGTFDIDLATQFGSAPNGAYSVKASASARVNGVINAVDPMFGGAAGYYTRVTKGLGASSSPVINSGLANTVPKGYAYKQNLNGVDPDGTAVTYASRAGQTDGPAFDIVSISSGGVVSMTAGQTNTYNDGDYFSYTVRVSDAQGDYSERDALLVVSGNNAPPSINGLSSSAYAANAGSSQSVNFTAADPNNANPKIDTVSLSLAAGTPAWASLTAPAGNPANATLTFNPPGNVPSGTYAFNVDAVDSDTNAPLFASEQVQVAVTNAVPDTTVGSKPNLVTNSTAAAFTFSSDESGVTYECKLDSGSWAGCTSPKSYTNLGDGSHDFQVRATDAALQTDATPDSYTWTVDSTAPAAPAVGTAPAAVSASSDFAWSGPNDAASYECKIDAGSWVACASPFTATGLTDGDHTLAIRAVDAAGNRGTTPVTKTWTLDTTAPATPTIDQAPNAIAQASAFAFSVPAGETAECRIDGGAWTSCASPLAPTGLADGAHTFGLRMVDVAGNRSAAATAAWTLDTAAPDAPALIGAPEGSTTATTARFEWGGETGGSFECKIDDGAFAPCVSPHTVSDLSLGDHKFTVRQIDAAGNVGAQRNGTWTVSKTPEPTPATPPATPTVTPTPTPAVVQPVTATNATVSVQGDTASVGCRVTGGTLTSCTVDVYAYDKGDESGVRVSGNKALAKATAAGKGKLVLIGTGRVKAVSDGATLMAVDIELNATGRRLVAERITGIEVVLKIEATTVQGPKLRSRTDAKLVPQKQLIVPAEGLFASRGVKLTKSAAKLVAKLGGRFRRVKAITCTGHTDSLGSDKANEKLGLARAKAVCAALKKNGARGKIVAKTAGESRPRATNATAKGRALNRRVEISVRYR